jgi:UDP-glucose 4-epimerase
MRDTMVKVLVVGGCGFIGASIAKELIAAGDEVVSFDSMVNYIDPLSLEYTIKMRSRLAAIKDKVKFIRGDIRHKLHVIKTVQDEQPDIIVNLAALSIDATSNFMPEEAVSVNLNGVINLLDACVQNPCVKRFIHTSSSMIYGDFQYAPCDENHPTNPKSIYGGTKLAGEIMTKIYQRRFGVTYTIIRPSAVYGPTEQNGRVSQLFIENAMRNKTLRLDGGGEAMLDFTYVTDVARGFVLAMKSEAAVNETFNITAGNGRKLREFVDILRVTFPNIKTIETPLDRLRPVRGTLDNSKARKLIGYVPKYQLEQGIPEYLAYLRTHKDEMC